MAMSIRTAVPLLTRGLLLACQFIHSFYDRAYIKVSYCPGSGRSFQTLRTEVADDDVRLFFTAS